MFTFERWAKHRNSMRYAKHLAHMFTSRVFKQLLGPVLAVMALALSVGIYETLVNVGARTPGVLGAGWWALGCWVLAARARD